jgi:8-amino-7-oxononanoate synthase
MEFYSKELAALRRAGRYRERRIYPEALIDLASNDYLGLGENRDIVRRAAGALESLSVHAPKASMLVNGYTQVHQDFEQALCRANGHEAGVVVGSGFAANIALIEALVRKRDLLLMDERYHASGMLASKWVEGQVMTFAHNDAEALASLLEEHKDKRVIVAVEGIYSMDGDLLCRQIIELADRYGAILLLDEAHSSGVIGPHLMGILDHYGMTPQPNHIKMGTLGKAYGSFGAYILASAHLVDYLINRAKPIIYATALSLFDTRLGHEALRYIQQHTDLLRAQIDIRREIIRETLKIDAEGLIVPIGIGDNRKVIEIQRILLESGILVGAIRQPTVPSAIIRLIARLGVEADRLQSACVQLRRLL